MFRAKIAGSDAAQSLRQERDAALADVEATLRAPRSRDLDQRGNPRLVGERTDGQPMLVVVAADDLEFVITVFLRT